MARALLHIVAGLAMGLGLTEVAFRARDGGAFPLVNVYQPDADRGVQLRPGSETLVGARGERVTRVRVNAQGYRGASFPPPSRDEVVVVGDSITFGLGVEEDERVAAILHEALPGRPQVIDASVPTYGPPEYRITAERILGERAPGTVVIVINLLNDFAELDRPNTMRHAAVDGWAVRVDPDTPAPASSRLREVAIQRSHAAFALWRWRRSRGPWLPPEDGLGPTLDAAMAVVAARHESEESHRKWEEVIASAAAARAEVAAATGEIVRLGSKYAAAAFRDTRQALDWHEALRHEKRPEDALFYLNYGGCIPAPLPFRSRRSLYRSPGAVNLALLQIAAVRAMPRDEARAVEEAFLRREAAEDRIRAASDAAPLGLGLSLVGYGYFGEERGAFQEGWKPPEPRPYSPQPLRPFVWAMQKMAADHGAALVVVPIPIDAQVSEEARERRGLSVADAAALDALAADVAETARTAGVRGVDPTAALKAVGAAAYLADGHLAPRGHEAVAHALAAAMAVPGR